jgi:hypothetical protein
VELVGYGVRGVVRAVVGVEGVVAGVWRVAAWFGGVRRWERVPGM